MLTANSTSDMEKSMDSSVVVRFIENYAHTDEKEIEVLGFDTEEDAKEELNFRDFFWHEEDLWSNGELWAEVKIID